MRLFTYFFIVLLVFFGLTFAVLNAEPVHFNYYIGQKTYPLALLLVLTLAMGGLFGFCGCLAVFLRIKKENYTLRKKIKLAEKEIANLRVMPLKDSH